MKNLTELAEKLRSGVLKSRELVDEALTKIDDPDGEGQRVYRRLYRERARHEADAVDAASSRGYQQLPFAGIPISIKDLFDCAGEVTHAGSHVLDEQPPAATDAVIVALLRQAGFIVLGKTNMTEFAFSGLGVNAHFGTPLNPWDRVSGRIPGGSSSGGAVSVADGMAAATIGTDTGGSCRIPAAFCGIVGFKPTANRVAMDGVIPLSSSLDSVGPLAASVRCCSILDAIMSGHTVDTSEPAARAPLRLGVMQGYVDEQLDEDVARSFASALKRLETAGHALVPVPVNELHELPVINKAGGLVGSESNAWHREYLNSRQEHYDPWVLSRLLFAENQTAAEYIDLLAHRVRLKKLFVEKVQGFDALVCPTVAIKPPALEELRDPAESGRINLLCLRNTAVSNFLDRPAISIPCHAAGDAPAGFMLMGHAAEDRQLLSIAEAVESTVRGDDNRD